MQNAEQEKAKQNILDKIFLKEEDTLKQLDEIVELAKNHFKVEFDTGDVVFSSNKQYSIKDKIILLLVARYLAKTGKKIESDEIDINEISNILSVVTTSLSKPLGNLISKGITKKSNQGKYRIVHHKIKETLMEMEK
jgi:hypothetical protein